MKPVRFWVGLVLVTLGVLGILDATGVLESGDVIASWWPAALAGLGVVAMLSQRRVSIGPAMVTVIGLVLLAGTLDLTTGDLWWPTILAIAGLAVLTGLRRQHSSRTPLVMFGGATTREQSSHLRHTDVSAIFGGSTLDLRQARIDPGATVDAFALFGGVKVLVPPGWRIELGGLPFMGGLEDKTNGSGKTPEDAPVLTVNGTAIFGGVEVTNTPDE
ncbi:LiaF transmembrane domain-containing protein [Amycolatopsis orientalis]|uniref:LiaF transmembrane domain-containing protein n=1 Tax=Amycolatopsis orientalis TaxID=31958 RepID=UPI00041F49AE|nr:LiaF domain-containing protein [Amycolatopsis orientalis]